MSTTTGPDRGPWIQSYTGVQIHLFDPSPDEVNLEDIGHHLALTTRYNGAPDRFYSVAQHSVLVSHFCEPEDALEALMHDCAEYVLGDIPRPLKHAPEMQWYRALEERWERVIADKYALTYPWPESVRKADARLLVTEKRDLIQPPQFTVSHEEWLHGARQEEPLVARLTAVSPGEAEIMWRHRLATLLHDRYNRRVKCAPFSGTPLPLESK